MIKKNTRILNCFYIEFYFAVDTNYDNDDTFFLHNYFYTIWFKIRNE